MTHQAVETLGQLLIHRGGLFLKNQAVQLIARRREDSVQKSEHRRILLPFASFMNESGKTFFNLASSLHTSRVSAYGFTAEAQALGMDDYTINEQLDNRICPVCEAMHGKKFSVTEARKLLEVVLRVKDPEDLKSLQPWPSQNPADIEALRVMTNKELVAKGWHIPPYHPKCRGMLSRVGKAPTLNQIKTNQIPPEGPYKASKEEFETLGIPIDQPHLAAWNRVVKLSPSEVIASLSGMKLDEFLDKVILSPSSIDKTVVFEDKKISMSVGGSFGKAKTRVAVSFDETHLNLFGLKANAAMGKKAINNLMQALYTTAQDAELAFIKAASTEILTAEVLLAYGFKKIDQEWLFEMRDTESVAKFLNQF
jgi:hypothetical protein